ncbi:VOC family protein [Marinilabiliaceae bacterium JC017]|nr:VOC family protein [Marinilabiliaceae bacterium JC017]
MELNNIRLLVNDFDKCFEFYADKLGLTVTWGKPGSDYASFDIGLPSGLSLFKSDLLAAAVGNEDKALPTNCREKMMINLKVPDVDVTYQELSKRGITFLNEPKNMPGWGIRMVHLRDPEENLLEIWSELPKEQWDQDLLKDLNEFGEK